MLNVVCVKVGTKYGPEYPNILFDMVRRNLREGFEGKFWCITDDPSGLDPEISIIIPPANLTGWWAKLWMFSPGLFPEGERILYFDLDVVIVGALEELANYSGEFAILREFNYAPGWQSSIMAWRSGYGHEVWNKWLEQDRPEVCGGDQEWIEEVLGKADLLQDIWPDSFLSYKLDCRVGHPPRGAKVIIFHGEPKPDNSGEEWVNMVWKIGGGTATELDLVCNTNDEVLKENIRLACKRDVPWLAQLPPHMGHAVIVGGAPSAAKYLDEIRWRQEGGQKIFALNNAFSWLRLQGIEPDAQVLVDAREENKKFIPRESKATHYIASQCHPEVWREAEGLSTVLWHSYNEILDDALTNPEKKPECLVGCGTTVGLSAMGICSALGYRNIHIYGMDSSYSEDKHHAYSQPLNDAETPLDVICSGKSFKASGWMIAQANQFQMLAIKLAEDGYTITVQGDGLIPWMAHLLQINSVPDHSIVETDGIFWPSRDKLGQNYILPSLRNIPRLAAMCEKRRVCVQAGGNTGLWPRDLANYFDRVITFEPDPLNFECLRRNCSKPNIEAHNKGLADKECRRGMFRDPSNCGAHALIEGDEVEVTTIDSLKLTCCDFLQLDIEGYEFFALQGAEETIRKFRPVICLELKSLGNQYGVTDSETVAWLTSRGYVEKQKMGRDVIFAPEEKEERVCDTLTETALHP